MSSRKQIFSLAFEARIDAINKIFSVGTLLRKCLTICQMLNREVEWIKLELYGYGKSKTREELEALVPSYRRVRLQYKNIYGGTVLLPRRHSFLTDYLLELSISQIEEHKYGLTIAGGLVDTARAALREPISSAVISAVQLTGVIESVRTRALEFVNNVILELEYGDILSNIFEETRKFVDSKLVEICPSAIEKLTKTYRDIVAGSSSLEWSKIAFACRDILQDFTDSVYKPDYLPKGRKPPTRQETKNKLTFTLHARMPKLKGKEIKLVESQIDYLLGYFGKLTDLIQKHTHPVGFEVEKEDACRCVMYTYLVIGDILKILEL